MAGKMIVCCYIQCSLLKGGWLRDGERVVSAELSDGATLRYYDVPVLEQ